VTAVVDLFSGRVAGWSMSATMRAQIVTDALVMVIWRWEKPHALLDHSDRGSHIFTVNLHSSGRQPKILPGLNLDKDQRAREHLFTVRNPQIVLKFLGSHISSLRTARRRIGWKLQVASVQLLLQN
jgi:hypothetical protein